MAESPQDQGAQPVALTAERAIAQLTDSDLSLRYYAAWWLGKMRVQEAVEPLLDSLSDTSDRTELGGYPLRRNAARALGKLGNPVAMGPLIRSLQCEDYYVREAVAQAIEEIAIASAAGFAAAQRAVAPLAELLTMPQQPYEAILETLGRLRAESCQELIATFLNHPQGRLHYAAARAMYSITQDPAYAEHLVAGLSHPDVNLRRTALNDLGEIAYLPAVAAIAQCQTESSFRLFALKKILDAHLPQSRFDFELTEPLQQLMLYMDELL
jgi:phycocyanobilin lyase alpha subunit